MQRLQGDETSQDSQVETLQHQLQEEAGKDDNQVVKEQEEQREKSYRKLNRSLVS